MTRPSAGNNFAFTPNPSKSLFYRFCRRAVWLFIKAWFRPSVSGPGVIPEEGPAVIAPVHRSNLDFAFAILATKRKLFFMAKDNLWESRILGWMLENLGAFPVHRESADRSALTNAEAVLAAGEVLVLFPEGTRREGPLVTDVLEGAGFLSARSNAPVLPVGLGGTAQAMPKGAALPRPLKVTVYLGELIPAPERSEKGRVPRSAIHRQTLAIQEGIQSAFDTAQQKLSRGRD